MVDNARNATFFAALNTANGFCSYFRKIFDRLETVYIIKGGSGTGKSRFMKEVATAANEMGYSVENFLCSSDSTSLDGIIVKELDMAILDGTSPHIHEPTLIGAREHFIDFGAYLDGDILKRRKEEIEALSEAKSRRYKKIYEQLKAVKIYDDIIMNTALNTLEKEKLDKSVKKSAQFLKKSASYEKKFRIRSAVSCNGNITLNTYAKTAKKRFAIADVCGLGGIYLKNLLDKTDEEEIAVTVSYGPFFPELPDALYYPEAGISFYIGTEGDFEETVINMRRFVNDGKLRPYKPELRAISKLRRMSLRQTEYDFSCIRRLHSAVEEIYMSAMDFEAKEKMTKEFIDSKIKNRTAT